MMDWLHCNTCATNPAEADGARFALTSCGHIFCSKCLETSTVPNCFVCETPNVRATEVGPGMKSDLRAMFQNNLDCLKSIYMTYGFQTSHARSMVALQQRNYTALVTKLKTITADHDELKRKLAKMQTERDDLKKTILSLEQQVKDRDEQRREVSREDRYQEDGSLRHSRMPQAANSGLFGLLKPQRQLTSPTFNDVPVNAFSSKTPALFKQRSQMVRRSDRSVEDLPSRYDQHRAKISGFQF